jgi:signal transduction histidine kinase/CheY-like chemotaxis protein/Tfp pilus assembly protein PilF
MSALNEFDAIIQLLNEAYEWRVSDLDKSHKLARIAYNRSRTLGNNLLKAKCLNHLSLVAMIRGEHVAAISLAKKALRIFQQLNDEQGMANAQYTIASVYYKSDNYHKGLLGFTECLTIYRKYNDFHNQARVFKSLGTIYEYMGDVNNAIISYKSAIRVSQKVRDLNLLSNAYNPLSGIYLKQNKIDSASKIINKSIEIKIQTGDLRGLAFALYGRGKVYLQKKQLELAKRDFKDALSIHLKMDERLGTGMTYCKLGALYIQLNKPEKAITYLEKAIELSSKYNILLVKYKSYHLLYTIYKQSDNASMALMCFEEYYKAKEVITSGQSVKIIESYELLAKMHLKQQEVLNQLEKEEILEKKNRAEESARLKQEFLSTMSHEIRTPLNAVLTIASLLSDKTSDEEKQLVESLKFAGDNLLLIVNNILDFTKLESGKAVIESQPQNMHQTLLNVKNIYDGMAIEKGLSLILSMGDQLNQGYVFDRTKLFQILGNLISNAIKFTNKGFVSLSVNVIKSDGVKDVIRFVVKDTGMGINKEFQEKIFESFFQPYSITTRPQGGSGLGLAIVKRLLDLHDSTIELQSQPSIGSVFTFDLVLERTTLMQQEVVAPKMSLKGINLLLVEDNPINAMVAMKLLNGWEVKTTHAKHGLEAIEYAKGNTFDVILMDIHMPELDGYATAKTIKEKCKNNRSTPILALTADITAVKNKDYEHFFDGFLRKPIEINVLREQLEKVIGLDSPMAVS